MWELQCYHYIHRYADVSEMISTELFLQNRYTQLGAQPELHSWYIPSKSLSWSPLGAVLRNQIFEISLIDVKLAY